jgi:hypothetical protein
MSPRSGRESGRERRGEGLVECRGGWVRRKLKESMKWNGEEEMEMKFLNMEKNDCID